MDKKEIKKILKKVWYFIWEDNSIWSWIVNVILAFLIIYFIFYPLIGLVFATSHPVVAVVSGSMEHDGGFDDWWESAASCNAEACTQALFYQGYNITKEEFLGFRYKNGFNKGDIMALRGTEPENIKTGDIIVFVSNRPDPIIHRVIKVWKQEDSFYFQTKGDHNSNSYPSLGENKISSDRVIGKAVARIPFLGYIKIYFMKLIGTPYCRLTNNFFPCRGAR